ncbi:MAG: aspartate ammonia-lyase [Acidobacteria bacterium]|nr:MAG: aspartate ammonia-lyase [Acidobacteriota bacterium]
MARRARRQARERIERDALGALRVPARAYYGIQTLRAVRNFPVSGRTLPPLFVRAYARIKGAAAETNASLGLLDARRARAIRRAAAEIVAGRHIDQFVVDVFQAGAGTSQNMNLNEVIANRAIELLGGRRGDYARVHPNDHVNMSQSTNDTFPAAMRIAILMALPGLLASLRTCEGALGRLARRFRRTVKAARTHLQDAVPIMLGQEFGAYAAMVRRAAARLGQAAGPLRRLNLGATAAGTGLNAHPLYAARVARLLSRDTGLRLAPAADLVEAAMSTADFAAFSSALRLLALDLGKVANDLRLLASGPATGLREIVLPAVQPGSSIMPGKVNPSICEMLNMVCFEVIGRDAAVAAASGAGQLELNVMMPVMIDDILEAMAILTAASGLFASRCLADLRADAVRCRFYFERSPALATAMNPLIGYAAAAELAKEAARHGRTIVELVREKGILPPAEARALFDPARLTRPGVAAAGGRRARVRPRRARGAGASPGRRD